MEIGLTASIYPEQDPVDDFVWAEGESGPAGVWCIDHLQGWIPRGVDSGVVEDPHAVLEAFSVLAAGAARTQSIGMGVSVADTLRRPTSVLLQTALSVASLAQRPLVLGLGSGAAVNLRPYGLEVAKPVSHLEEACQRITELRQEATRPDDSASSGPPMGLGAVASIEIWLAAHGRRMIDLTARYGDGWIPSGLTPDGYQSRLDSIRRLAAEHGRDPAAIRPALFVWAALGQTREESLALLESPYARFAALFRNEASFRRSGLTRPLGDAAYVPSEFDGELAQALMREIPAKAVAESVVHGPPDEVAAHLRKYQQVGCQYAIIHDVGRYVDADGRRRSRENALALIRALGDD